MKINNYMNKGFSRLSVLAILVFALIIIFLASCSGGEDNKVAENRSGKSLSSSESPDSSTTSSGLIAQTTCLDCHPGMKDGGFDIDFSKVKEAGMIIDKGQDVIKEDKKESEE